MDTNTLSRALTSGSFAGLVTTAAISMAGERESGNAVAPINATSHVLWGDDEAGSADSVDLKHTVPGLLINTSAGVFWAFVHELLLQQVRPRDPVAAMASGAAVAALAYVVDYHLIPRRLSPGWDLRLSRRGVALGFATLGACLAVAGLVRSRR